MFDIMTNAGNAMKAYEAGLKINTANMGNMGTVGYKSIKYNFQSIFGQVLNNGSAGSMTLGGTNPVQQGQGVALSSVKIDFSQGELGSGGQMDLAIQGNGFFVLSGESENENLYTRAGNFSFDNDGYLVDNAGRKVFGFPALGHGQFGTELELIRVEQSQDVGWQYEGTDGILMQNYEQEKSSEGQSIYKIALTDFSNRSGLIQHDGTTFKSTASSGPPFFPSEANLTGFGSAVSGMVEKSNVFFIGETIDASQTQRAMQASLTSMKLAGQIIDNVIQMLGN